MTWIDSVIDGDYEISTEYPYHLRRKDDRRVIKEWNNGNGYIRLKLNGHNYYKHRIVALQFIENDDPEHKTEVDHVYQHRNDYHVENLRWITPKGNNENKLSHLGIQYEYVDDDNLPDDIIEVTDYGNHEFDDYYYSESLDRFMFWNGIRTRILHVNHHSNGSAYVDMRDKNNRRVKVFYSKFKKLYGLRN